MNRFWDLVIYPVLEKINANTIVEIGCAQGINTRNILRYCQQRQGKLYGIDPAPCFDVQEWKEEFGSVFEFYQELSLSALPLIDEYDAVLIDGDHNWYTVYNELKIIEKKAEELGKFPVVFLHDIGWPYGRRDMYYDPNNIPELYRQPFAQKGIQFGISSLAETGGFNSHLNNAVYENNPQNGVLTAAEDFIKQTSSKIDLIRIPLFNGLGALYDESTLSFDIKDFFQSICSSEEFIEQVEGSIISKTIENVNLQTKLFELDIYNSELQKMIEFLKDGEKDFSCLKKELEKKNNDIIELKHMLDEKDKININLKSAISDLENRLEESKEKNGEIVRLLHQEKKKTSELEKQLINLRQKLSNIENIHRAILNTVRYRLGDIIISALKPSKNTILFPYNLIRLIIQGVAQVKERRRKRKQGYKNKNRNSLTDHNLSLENLPLEKVAAREFEKLVKETQEAFRFKLSDRTPIVSIIILNRNGAHHLKRLLQAIKDKTVYPNFEIILVDNNSTDSSLEVVGQFHNFLDIKIIKNNYNGSFSECNNKAAKQAVGEYILLLNNDVEPITSGWLNELMKCIQSQPGTGIVGAKLIYPPAHPNKNLRYTLQHTGIAFCFEEEFIRPYNIGKGRLSTDIRSNIISQRAGVTAAALLIKKDLYFKLGAMDEKFIYGYEDVDLCLKAQRVGLTSIYCPTSILFHYEFGTQEKNSNDEIRERRLNNQYWFQRKWHFWLKRQVWKDKIESKMIFSEKPLKVAFAVTESGSDAAAGDYFTAMELGEALKGLGWDVKFLSRKGQADWYNIGKDTDVLISMLDSYDLNKIKNARHNLIKIAWLRNWFEKWPEMPGFSLFDIILASSEAACKMLKEKYDREAILFPIATNHIRFDRVKEPDPKFSCDYCFTGSYWNDPREIVEFLCPEEIPYKFHLYGKNWGKIKKFRPYHRGFIKYEEIPQLYKSTKIVIDDANRVTKPYGSVNSRVFDALASGVLVLTNGELGSMVTFEGKLPVFHNKDELKKLLEFYLGNESERVKKVNELKNMVLINHTYTHRAAELKGIITKYIEQYKIAIKIAAPRWETVNEWGDYHLAMGLKKQFEIRGYPTIIQILPEWDDNQDSECDIVIVLRGLNAYKPKPKHLNIMWNISHPDDVAIDEYNEYDYVFVASEKWAKEIDYKTSVKVEPMLQCTDPDVFKSNYVAEYEHELLFVGNSRKVFRKIIRDILPTDRELAVYGTHWNKFIDDKYLKGEHIPNKELHKYYSSCKILLNDHWDDMREKGFISNRIFDGFAAGAFIISDKVEGAEAAFDGALVCYETPEELEKLINFYLKDENARVSKVKKGAAVVRQKHTYAKRVEQIIKVIVQHESKIGKE